jgi:hypothetical protein
MGSPLFNETMLKPFDLEGDTGKGIQGLSLHRRQGKNQAAPGRAFPAPDQQVYRRQRETRGRDHGPDDGNPIHMVDIIIGSTALFNS